MSMRVAVLVDLPREAAAGGHVKYWERIAQAAAKENLPVDLTIYFSGAGADELLSPRVRFRFLPPVFSTERLKFLPYVPAHTDIAPFHPRLAQELPHYDVIHTTDGFFAFARTAERVGGWNKIPLVTSFHTDTPAYAEFFTKATVQNLLGHKFGGWLDGFFRISAAERIRKEKRVKKHLRKCAAILAMRPEDIALAQSASAQDRVKPMRLGVDKDLFVPQADARAAIEREYAIEPGKFMVLFVGRVDAGKNMPILLQACIEAIAKGVELHLVVAGIGPMSDEVKAKLKDNVTLVGQIEARELSRLYAAAQCTAIASDIEIGGMIGLEALACGCPVLVSRQSGVAQLCADTKAMQKVESTVAAWAEALTVLACDAAKQKEMRDAALLFRQDRLAGWGEILNANFIPVWENVAREKNNVRQANSDSGRPS